MTLVLTYSFLNDFENCPRKAWHRYVAKDLPREPKSEAQSWGIAVHDGFKARLTEGKALPVNMFRYEPLALSVERAADGKKMMVEEWFAINAVGQPVGAWDKDVWLKGKPDVLIYGEQTGFIPDWKTGKKREDAFELEVFGLLAKCKFRGLNRMVGAYIWLQEAKAGKIHDLSNFAATFNKIKAIDKTVQMLPVEKEWDANPNPLCGWCPVKKCEHNKS